MSYDDEDTPEVDEARQASERAVLGTVMQSAEKAREVALIVSPEHFADTSHRAVFAAVMRLADDGEPVDPASVLSELARTGMLGKIRGRDAGAGTGGAFLHTLLAAAQPASAEWHAWKIRDAWQRDQVTASLHAGLRLAVSPGFEPGVHLDQIRKLVDDATALAPAAALRPNSETVMEVLGSLEDEEDPGIPTGYSDLDDAIGGLRPGELLVIGARPGSGKTLLAGGIAEHVATRLALPVLFSSLEMTEKQLTQRRISAAAKVPLHHIVRHQVTDFEWDLIRRAQDRLLKTELYIDDTRRASVAHMRGRLRDMARAGHAARVLIIDYLGYMGAPRADSRQQAIAELVRDCKDLAREIPIPVVLLAQLNRQPETRSDKVPSSADLRESGEIEQSADIIILLHNPAVTERESPRAGEIDLIVTKNRQGPLCTVTLCFQGHYGRIVSMSRSDWSPSSALGDSGD